MSDTAQDQARAQLASIVEMVAALDVDYQQLEHLRDKKKYGHWIAGWNMPGYMPDNEPSAFDDCDDAREYLALSIEDDADCIDVRQSPEDAPKMQALREAAAKLREAIETEPDSEFGQTVGQLHYFVTFMPNALADEEEEKELAELEEAAGYCESKDDARERIEQNALSVEVRSDWCNPGEEMTAGEFRILLCTGGPHVEIVGDLDRGEPSRPRILYKDWGESGELFDFDRDAVLRYCSVFFFGE